MLSWHSVSLFFGGVLLTNAVPHLISGVMGRPFQTPFAKPHGRGLSSSTVNVLWGVLNLAIAYVLLGPVGQLDLRAADQVAVVGLGILVAGLFCARWFGRFNGGNAPVESSGP